MKKNKLLGYVMYLLPLIITLFYFAKFIGIFHFLLFIGSAVVTIIWYKKAVELITKND